MLHAWFVSQSTGHSPSSSSSSSSSSILYGGLSDRRSVASRQGLHTLLCCVLLTRRQPAENIGQYCTCQLCVSSRILHCLSHYRITHSRQTCLLLGLPLLLTPISPWYIVVIIIIFTPYTYLNLKSFQTTDGNTHVMNFYVFTRDSRNCYSAS